MHPPPGCSFVTPSSAHNHLHVPAHHHISFIMVLTILPELFFYILWSRRQYTLHNLKHLPFLPSLLFQNVNSESSWPLYARVPNVALACSSWHLLPSCTSCCPSSRPAAVQQLEHIISNGSEALSVRFQTVLEITANSSKQQKSWRVSFLGLHSLQKQNSSLSQAKAGLENGRFGWHNN